MGEDDCPPTCYLLSFEVHEVHRRADTISALNVVDRRDLASIEEHSLSESSFT